MGGGINPSASGKSLVENLSRRAEAIITGQGGVHLKKDAQQAHQGVIKQMSTNFWQCIVH